ncbi:enoyl-CoA hydratase/isomerase family protein [Paraburkholderia unamae]|uniref:3-hydroxyisobutyryl-CoA hydrolase n=1 Tax=Paraburkholderia unamae TaxID=219649 RepID=A0ABX5KE19_9BURK|nr:enoyl-CoA hydratase/isomerase family protein [Paraburkholderia unamae]PVX75704.1 enoyl-CoA hydratase/carnithine racemase [Paraburkholderia unamae]RAR57907.1 enoyl-CoA hydratase/carnithine racemase [Paraburkholderia unamae]
MSDVLDVVDAVTPGRAVTVAANDAPEPALDFRLSNRVAIMTLNRPAVINALSHDMVREMASLVERCRSDREIVAVVLRGAGVKGFCAGGDVRALYRAATLGYGNWREFFVDEYRLDFALHSLHKPLVALIDGVTMSGGMGLAQAASLRIVTERTRLAMPEARIGFVPDVGATRFLADLPVELALYVALTGQSLTGADAIRYGLADAYAPGRSLQGFEKRLGMLDMDDVRQSIRDVFVSPANAVPPSEIVEFMPLIGEHFAARSSVEEIVESIECALQRERPVREREWLQTTLDALLAGSPLMLNVTREALLRGRAMSLADCFRMEFDLATRAIEVGDFCEGVRARMVDKDGAPRWMFRALKDVNPAIVRRFLCAPSRVGPHPLADLGA